MIVNRDHQSRTCIEVERDKKTVSFIPLSIDNGLRVEQLSIEEFDKRFEPLTMYPVEKACQLYLTYARQLGATPEVISKFRQIIPVTNEEADMATKKQSERVNNQQPAEKPKRTTKADKQASLFDGKQPKASTKPEKAPAAEKKPVKVVKPKVVSEKPKDKKQTASDMFKELIMAGKLTDDEIFARVQSQFNLDEKKRGYVKWYRNDLRKKGLNPPEAKA